MKNKSCGKVSWVKGFSIWYAGCVGEHRTESLSMPLSGQDQHLQRKGLIKYIFKENTFQTTMQYTIVRISKVVAETTISVIAG